MTRRANLKVRFVRALLRGAQALPLENGGFRIAGEPVLKLNAAETRMLMSDGVVTGNRQSCAPSSAARSWLKRQMLDADALAAQHRTELVLPGGITVNLEESPLMRLARPEKAGAAPFLSAAQVEAGEIVRRLVERAALGPKMTMSYDAARRAGGEGRGLAGELSDMAVDARQALREIHDVLPRDCASAIVDICGFLKGLQLVETERGWPRRSAKLVLRIGLDQLARHYGIGEMARGPERSRPRQWMDADGRPEGWP